MRHLIPVSAERFVLNSAAATALLLTAAGPVYAQSIQGSVLGVVKDSSGASIPGASIVLHNESDGTDRTLTSSSAGEFDFTDSKAGRYSITITRQGFQSYVARGLVLIARQQLRIDPILAVGSVQQEVQVTADSLPDLETDSASVAGTYNNAEVQDLPVNTRANASGTSALGIVGSLPGVSTDTKMLMRTV